jgi:hypothetical protein
MGVTNSFGVIGRSLTGLIVDHPGSFISGTSRQVRCRRGSSWCRDLRLGHHR